MLCATGTARMKADTSACLQTVFPKLARQTCSQHKDIGISKRVQCLKVSDLHLARQSVSLSSSANLRCIARGSASQHCCPKRTSRHAICVPSPLTHFNKIFLIDSKRLGSCSLRFANLVQSQTVKYPTQTHTRCCCAHHSKGGAANKHFRTHGPTAIPCPECTVVGCLDAEIRPHSENQCVESCVKACRTAVRCHAQGRQMNWKPGPRDSWSSYLARGARPQPRPPALVHAIRIFASERRVAGSARRRTCHCRHRRGT